MNRKILLVAVCLIVAGVSSLGSCSGGPAIQNPDYRVELTGDGAAEVQANGSPAMRFEPRFTIIRAKDDPRVGKKRSKIKVAYDVTTWITDAATTPEHEQPVLRDRNSFWEVGDGHQPLKYYEEQGVTRSGNLYRPGTNLTVVASEARLDGGQIIWEFPNNAGFELTARLTLPDSGGEPLLRFQFQPKADGFYSIGYTGAPSFDPADTGEVFQPLIWQEKRFPDVPYLTLSDRCTVPSAFVTKGGVTVGAVADPDEFPFDELPAAGNARFGVAVRSQDGMAQPALFAPVLGGVDSEMAAGDPYEFRLRLLVHQGDSPSAFRHVAERIYGFRDYRRNLEGTTLNRTLENIIDYALSEYSMFNYEFKGSNYATDVPGAVKNVSSLYSLSAAVVTDSEKIFREQAYPMVEYMLSREKFLFSNDPKIRGQGTSWRMRGPAAPVTELAALHMVAGGKTPVFLELAREMAGKTRVLNIRRKSPGDNWPNLLALYQASGEQEYLDRAIAGADRYIEQRVNQRIDNFDGNFVGGPPEFWTQFAPEFASLHTLYRETGEQRFLEAARTAARYYSMVYWMCPRIPDTKVLVNKGGVAPRYPYLASKGHPVMKAPERLVDAWKLSAIGLTTEAANTSSRGNRAMFPMNPSPALLRIGHDTGDTFLIQIARAGVIGRYQSFPGYHINTGRSDIMMEEDYPLRPFNELSYTPFHPNHIWPHVAFVIDHLVSEAAHRSEGEIDFPSHFVEGYAYLQSRVYGDRPGRFHGDDEVRLWMPRRLARTDSDQINYVAARGNGRLYFALMNASPEPLNTVLHINPELVGIDQGEHRARVWQDGIAEPDKTVRHGQIEVSVSAKGITAVAIDGLEPQVCFQHRAGQGKQLPRGSFHRDTENGVHGLLLEMGEGLTTAYLYLDAVGEEREIEQARFHYRTNGGWTSVTDGTYPFELTVPLTADDSEFTFYVEKARFDGSSEKTEEILLRR